MAKAIYIGVNGVARKVKQPYIGAPNFEKVTLPSGYTQVNHIQSSGTQHIDTLYKFTSENATIEIGFEFTEAPTGNSLFGSEASGQYSIVAYGHANTNLGFYVGKNGGLLPQTIKTNTHYDLVVTANNGALTVSMNGNTVSGSYTGSIQNGRNVTIFANNIYSGVGQHSKIKLKYFRIRDNGVLVRNFITCKNSSGTGGLFELVNGDFYGNAGSGTFTVGTSFQNVARKVKAGYIGVNGVARQFFSGDVPIGELSVGDTVKLNVNGTPWEFIIVNKGLPSTLYDSSCDGVWLLMKNNYTKDKWNTSPNNRYANSSVKTYLEGTFYNSLDSNVRALVKQVKIPYATAATGTGSIASGSNGLSAKIFLLSGYEIGFTTASSSKFPVDGACLDYFVGTSTGNDTKRVTPDAYPWWSRSLNLGTSDTVFAASSTGDAQAMAVANNLGGVRPALILPHDTLVSGDLLITG